MWEKSDEAARRHVAEEENVPGSNRWNFQLQNKSEVKLEGGGSGEICAVTGRLEGDACLMHHEKPHRKPINTGFLYSQRGSQLMALHFQRVIRMCFLDRR